MQSKSELEERIRVAQLTFAAAASRLVDEAVIVRQHRDELLELLAQADRARNREQQGASHA